MEVKQIKCGKVRDGFDALTSLCEKEAQKLCTQLDIQPNTTVEVSFWTKISRNLSVLGNSLRMRTVISLLFWIIQNLHSNKILSDSSLSCVSNPILKSPRPAPHGAGRGQNISRNYAGVLASKKR